PFRSEGRRFPIDHDDLGAARAAAQQDVLAEVLPVEHAVRQRAEPLDARLEILEATRHEVVLRPLEVGQELRDALGAAPVVRLVEAGEKSRSEEHTSELQSLRHLVCRLLLEKKKQL